MGASGVAWGSKSDWSRIEKVTMSLSGIRHGPARKGIRHKVQTEYKIPGCRQPSHFVPTSFTLSELNTTEKPSPCSSTHIAKVPLYRKPPKLIIPRTLPNMPLVVPGVTNQSDNQTELWSNKLVGKKITDDEASNEVVSHFNAHAAGVQSRVNTDHYNSLLRSVTCPSHTGSSHQARW